MNKKNTALDCRACGACCASLGVESPTIAYISERDLPRMSSRTLRLHVIQAHEVAATKAVWKLQRTGLAKGVRACVCSALRGSLLSRVSCSIYESRPEICRQFEVGGKDCIQAREEAGIVFDN